MNKKNIGLRAATNNINLIQFPGDSLAQKDDAGDLAARIDKAAERRDEAQERTCQFDAQLAEMQSRYIVCAEPGGVWDTHENKLIKEHGFKLTHLSPKTTPPNGGKQISIGSYFLNHPKTTRCHYFTFRPGRPKLDGDYLNHWDDPQIQAIEGDISPFLEHLDYVYDGVQEAIDYTLNWMALPLQIRGTKMESAVFLGGEQGTGKTFLGEILRVLHGHANTAKIKGEELESQFNDFMMRSTIVCVEEVYMKGKWTLMDKIKDTITSTNTRVNLKHVTPYEIPNVTNFILFSNHADALAISEGDRRWHVHVSHQSPKNKEYYEQFHTWLDEDHGYEKIYNHLLQRDLTGFNRYTKPPLTQCKQDMAFSSKGYIEQKISDDITDRVGIFACDLITKDLVIENYKSDKFKPASKQEIGAITHALTTLAANTGQRVRVKFKVKSSAEHITAKGEIKGENLRLWSVREHARWRKASPDELRAELKNAHPNIVLKED